MVESLGDYYAAARISGAPVPPPDVLARGVTWQGISCVLTGAWGSGNGTTAYNVCNLSRNCPIWSPYHLMKGPLYG